MDDNAWDFIFIYINSFIPSFDRKSIWRQASSKLAAVRFHYFICVPSILLVRHTKLVTRIDNNSIYYGWNIPTDELNEIKFVDIASCDVIKYSFVGYGYRISAKYGTVYNTSGNEGLQIITKSGDKILVGTHKSAELADALRKMNVRHNL